LAGEKSTSLPVAEPGSFLYSMWDATGTNDLADFFKGLHADFLL
jgi:hypothetical protein